MNQIKWKKNKIKSTKKWMRLWQDFQRKECKRFEAKIYKDKKDELPQNNIYNWTKSLESAIWNFSLSVIKGYLEVSYIEFERSEGSNKMFS